MRMGSLKCLPRTRKKTQKLRLTNKKLSVIPFGTLLTDYGPSTKVSHFYCSSYILQLMLVHFGRYLSSVKTS